MAQKSGEVVMPRPAKILDDCGLSGFAAFYIEIRTGSDAYLVKLPDGNYS